MILRWSFRFFDQSRFWTFCQNYKYFGLPLIWQDLVNLLFFSCYKQIVLILFCYLGVPDNMLFRFVLQHYMFSVMEQFSIVVSVTEIYFYLVCRENVSHYFTQLIVSLCIQSWVIFYGSVPRKETTKSILDHFVVRPFVCLSKHFFSWTDKCIMLKIIWNTKVWKIHAIRKYGHLVSTIDYCCIGMSMFVYLRHSSYIESIIELYLPVAAAFNCQLKRQQFWLNIKSSNTCVYSRCKKRNSKIWIVIVISISRECWRETSPSVNKWRD